MTLFQDRYRIESARLQGRDYAAAGTYLVTVCTKNRRYWFGEVHEERMVLNSVGMIVVEELMNVEGLRKNVCIDSWIVMPNHVHVILQIVCREDVGVIETAQSAVSTDVAVLILIPRLQPNSLGSIVGAWKAGCSRRIRGMGITHFQWQERFHDRILRTEHAVEQARSYIHMNPMRWHRDRNNTNAETAFMPSQKKRKTQ
jgi:REP element-mobilizing transposase RayT